MGARPGALALIEAHEEYLVAADRAGDVIEILGRILAEVAPVVLLAVATHKLHVAHPDGVVILGDGGEVLVFDGIGEADRIGHALDCDAVVEESLLRAEGDFRGGEGEVALLGFDVDCGIVVGDANDHAVFHHGRGLAGICPADQDEGMPAPGFPGGAGVGGIVATEAPALDAGRRRRV